MTRALREVPTPEHRAGFWDALEQRLVAEGPDPSGFDALSAGSWASGDGSAAALDAQIMELPWGSEVPQRRWGRLFAVAAAVLVFAVSVATLVVAESDDAVDVEVRPGSDTTSPTSTAAKAGSAQRAALDWLELLAAGEMRAAWERLGADAKDVWPSFDAFAASRSAFAEGMALWVSAEGRQVGTAALESNGGDALYVVTITGKRRPEGREEEGALVVIVRGKPDGKFLIEPFSPNSAGLRFTSPASGPQPSELDADEPVVLEPVGAEGRLFFVLDRNGEPIEATPVGSGTPSYVPPGGWSSGRHVVTAVLAAPSGQAIGAAVVFDVP